MKIVASNKCKKCEYTWSDLLKGPETICPKCGSVEIKWLNYKMLKVQGKI